MMPPADLERLKEKINDAIVALPAGATVAIVGWCGAAFELSALPVFSTGAAKLEGIFALQPVANARALDELASCRPDIVVIAERDGAACPNTELASISGALRVWHWCRVVHGGGRAALATQCTTDAVGNSCSPLKPPV